MKLNDLVAANAETIDFKLNGETISAFAGETIIQAAARHGTDIPHLCYKDGYRPDGNCRACVVEIKGERVLAPSCCRQPAKGMEVSSNNERAVHSQKLVIELLMSDVPKKRLFRWIVSTQTGTPTRYPASAIHPSLLENDDVLSTAAELGDWIRNRK